MADIFYAKDQCLHSPVRCGVVWGADNTTITSLGPYIPGNFTANPGLVGPGVLWAFAIPTLMFALTSILVPLGWLLLSPDHWQNIKRRIQEYAFALPETESEPDAAKNRKISAAVRAYLLGFSDTQNLLAIAYCAYFYLTGKCTLSYYHYSVAVSLILLSLATFVWSTVLIADLWTAPGTLAFRHAAQVTVIVLLALILANLRSIQVVPAWSRGSGAYLLPAACFLDLGLNARVLDGLTDAQHDALGWPTNPRALPEISFFIVTCVLGLVPFGRNIFHCLRKPEAKAARPKIGWRTWLLGIYRVFAYCCLLATALFCFIHIMILREWVDQSGWVALDAGVNPESKYDSIGQILPLVLLAMAFVPLLNELKLDVDKSKPGAGEWRWK